MKLVFVGDIHGKVEAVERALAMDGHKVFVGDFMDSFDRSATDHRRGLELALDASEKGEATLIYGNHELSYLMPQVHRCSGYSEWGAELFEGLRPRIEKEFVPFFMPTGRFLVTHAGLSSRLVGKVAKGRKLRAMLNKWWLDTTSPMHYIGFSRGGSKPVGGTFWCDWSEFDPVHGLTQVFGHTRVRHGQRGFRSVEDSHCIDCLDADYMVLEREVRVTGP